MKNERFVDMTGCIITHNKSKTIETVEPKSVQETPRGGQLMTLAELKAKDAA